MGKVSGTKVMTNIPAKNWGHDFPDRHGIPFSDPLELVGVPAHCSDLSFSWSRRDAGLVPILFVAYIERLDEILGECLPSFFRVV